MISTELQLAEDMGKLAIDPLKFVMYAFPWGKAGTALEHETGPEEWQRLLLLAVGEHVRKHRFDGTKSVPCFRAAVSSGHGVGKSTLSSWLILWIMSTRPHCKGTVTANTYEQLHGKTWAELAKWHALAINRHWFWYHNSHGNMSIYQADHKDTWFCRAFTCEERKSEAFAGQHAVNSSSFYIFDEASAIPDKIYEVSEGGLTDGEPMFFAFGNPTRNNGQFFEAFNRLSHRYYTSHVDSREVTRTNKEQIDNWVKDYGEDSDFVRVRVRGVFPRAGSLQFIPSDIVRAAQERKLHESQYSYAPRVIGVDVARFGDDQSVICKRQGLAVQKLLKFRNLDTFELARIVAAQCRQYAPAGLFIDEVGIGAGVIDALRSMGIDSIPVNAGCKASQPGYFNLRAEMWGSMKEWLAHGAWLPEDPELEQDLLSVEYGYTHTGQIQLEKKSDLKKRGIRSPDCADALAMTFAFPVEVRETYPGVKKPRRCETEYDVLPPPRQRRNDRRLR